MPLFWSVPRLPWRRWRLALGLAALLLGLSLSATPRSAAAVSPSAAIPIDAYWQQLAALQSAVDSAARQPLEARQAALAPSADIWEAITGVTLADGTLVPLDHRALVADLRAPAPNLADLKARLATLAAAHAGWPEARHDAADLTQLQAILNRPEFAWTAAPPNPLAELWDRFVTAFVRFLARLIPNASVPFVGNFVGYAVTALSVLVVVAVVLYALRGLLGGLVREVTLPADAALDAGDLNPEAAQQQAARLAGQGDYRTAVRYLYLSALLSLEARGLLRYERTLTNREVLRRLSDHPELAGVLREVVEVFDRVWYGFQPLDAATYSQYADRVAALRQAQG